MTKDGKQQRSIPTVTITTKSSGNNIITAPVDNAVYHIGDPAKLDFTFPYAGIGWHYWYVYTANP